MLKFIIRKLFYFKLYIKAFFFFTFSFFSFFEYYKYSKKEVENLYAVEFLKSHKIKESWLYDIDMYMSDEFLEKTVYSFYQDFFEGNFFLKMLDNIIVSKDLYFTKSFLIHYVLSTLFVIIGLLISVAFFTLLERKVMASMQRRKGPNVVGFWGLLQPLADGVKLLVKEIIIPKRSNIFIFLGAPLYTFAMSLLGWSVMPLSEGFVYADPKLSALFILAVSSLGVYGVLLAGWSSNSKYAFLGGLRSAAQMISYEVSLGFIVIIVVLFSGTYNLREIVYMQEDIWYCFPLCPLVLIFFVSMLAETNRAPFDLPEAEAELVAGYNTEYSSIIFAMFFLGEYSSMLLMSAMMVIFFFGGWLAPFFFPFKIFSGFWFFFKIFIISFLYVWVRATLPRYRYNQLMNIGWKIFLPLTFGLLIFYLGLLIFLDGLPPTEHQGILSLESYIELKNEKDVILLLKDYLLITENKKN